MEEAAQRMYYGGDLAELALAVALFATWYRQGRRRRTRSATNLLDPGEAGLTHHSSSGGENDLAPDRTVVRGGGFDA